MSSELKQKIAAVWGLIGVFVLLSSAVYRLSARAFEAVSHPLTAFHWTAIVVGVGFMAYSEGYRGFQKAFSPRVAARARFLREHATTVETLLAPFFLMGYFGATRKRQVVSISLTIIIIAMIVTVRFLPSPWRGIIDAAVVVGLIWGIVALAIFTYQAWSDESFPYSPEVPSERLDPHRR